MIEFIVTAILSGGIGFALGRVGYSKIEAAVATDVADVEKKV